MDSMIEHRFVEANGIRFHVALAGHGPLVLLLHGFPECWYSWRLLLPVLAQAGYRAAAPDLRGYNLTDKPQGGYDIETLVEDVVSLARQLGDGRPVHVVGHDWGGIIAWQAAWRHPEALRSLTVMNAPHPTAFARYVRRRPRQLLKSSYMLLFQAPGIPEWLLARARAQAVASAFRRSAHRHDVFSDADLEVYREAALRPGAATAALNYYRQAIRQGSRALPTTRIRVPTLLLWGMDDPVLEWGSNADLGAWVENLRVRQIRDCGHWTQQERPDVVHSEVLGWFAEVDTPLGTAAVNL
jgi:pimeloyl-ACP methyl ester carboxylesterase